MRGVPTWSRRGPCKEHKEPVLEVPVTGTGPDESGLNPFSLQGAEKAGRALFEAGIQAEMQRTQGQHKKLLEDIEEILFINHPPC